MLKFVGAGQGPRALIAELVAGEIARALGLAVPEIVFAHVDAELARTEPDPEIQDLIRASAGVILSCAASGFSQARIELIEARPLALDPDADVAGIRAGLAVIPVICAGGPAAGALGALSSRERFHWLVAPRSTSIQTSPVHTGRCESAELQLEHLMQQMVRRPSPHRRAPGAPVPTPG